MPNIAKNTALMMAGSVGQKIISLLYFTFVARTIGVENTGLYTAALAMSSIFVVFVDLGFSNVFIREAAKARDNIQNYFSSVLSAKIVCGVLSYAAMWLTLTLFGFEPAFTQLVYISGITMLFDSYNLTAYGALRAYGNLGYESLAMAASQFLTLILGTLFLLSHLPLIFLILAFTTASSLNAIYVTLVLRRKFGLYVRPRYNPKLIRELTWITIPFTLAAIFGRLYSYLDVVLLKKLAGNVAVGFYTTPSKITFAFQFIPLALIASLYPRFSEYYATDRDKLAVTFVRSCKYLAAIALPLSIGIFVLAHDIIVFVFTKNYLPAERPLKILILSLLFSFLSFPIGAMLNACDRQATQTRITGAILLTNIILNLILIPRYGPTGAATAALVGNILLGGLGYYFIKKITPLPHRIIFSSLARIGAAALVMGVVVAWVNSAIGLIPATIAGMLVYVTTLLFFRGIAISEIREVFALVKK